MRACVRACMRACSLSRAALFSSTTESVCPGCWDVAHPDEDVPALAETQFFSTLFPSSLQYMLRVCHVSGAPCTAEDLTPVIVTSCVWVTDRAGFEPADGITRDQSMLARGPARAARGKSGNVGFCSLLACGCSWGCCHLLL